MAEEAVTHATMEVPSAPHGGEHGQPNVMEVSTPMVILTWVTFAIVAVILYKVAWRPILNGLEKREADIRRALEEARKTREEYARIEDERRKVIDDADAKAKAIVEGAREAAVQAAQAIENKAREEAQILLATAQREIRTAQDKAVADLRRESADLAVGIARKILRENLDEARSRALADQLIKEV